MNEDKDPRIAWVTDEKTHTSITEGHTIVERSYGGELTKDDPKDVYWGVGALVLNAQTPQGVQQHTHEFMFPIKAGGLREAFMKFKATYREAAEREGERLQKRMEAERNRIVTASASDSKKILAAS